MKRITRSRSATPTGVPALGAQASSRSLDRRALRLRLALLAGGALLALWAGQSLRAAPAHATTAFGTNGRIACAGTRPIGAPTPPAGVSRTEIFTVNPDGSDEALLTKDASRNKVGGIGRIM